MHNENNNEKKEIWEYVDGLQRIYAIENAIKGKELKRPEGE